MKNIYILKCNSDIVAAFSTEELAKKALSEKKKETLSKAFPAKYISKDIPEEFKYSYGWEEMSVHWRVSSMNVLEDIKEFK